MNIFKFSNICFTLNIIECIYVLILVKSLKHQSNTPQPLGNICLILKQEIYLDMSSSQKITLVKNSNIHKQVADRLDIPSVCVLPHHQKRIFRCFPSSTFSFSICFLEFLYLSRKVALTAPASHSMQCVLHTEFCAQFYWAQQTMLV